MLQKRVTLFGVVLCIIVVVSFTGCASKSSPTEPQLVTAMDEMKNVMQELEKTAERFYKFTEQHKFDQAHAELNVLGRLIPQQHYDGLTTVEGLEALTHTVNEASKAFAKVAFNSRQAMRSAAQVRLAVDALNHERRPMWMAFEHTFAADIKKLKQALAEKDYTLFVQLVEESTAQFNTIRPAVIVSGRIFETEAIESLVRAIHNTLDIHAYERLPQMVEHYARLTTDLFQGEAMTMGSYVNKNEILFWTLAFGGIIMAVLSYVAWRRYQYERNHYTPVHKREREMGS